MAVHVFTVSEENFRICIERGIVALPEPSEGNTHDNVFDGLVSRISGIKEDDYVLIYIIKPKCTLCGVWQVEGQPFYEETQIWEDRLYPFRCRIRWSEYKFNNPLILDSINDLRNTGKIWTWALLRPATNRPNAMFSIADVEFRILLNEFMKINPYSMQRGIIQQPYPYHENNLARHLHTCNGMPKYESTVMALLNTALSEGRFTELFGNYTDHLCYVPTNLGKEMDIMLIFDNPINRDTIVSFDIIEVNKERFDLVALRQLINYESWFIQKKVFGDLNMVRTTAIAKTFSDDVIDYVRKRTAIENKPIKRLMYSFTNNTIELNSVS